MGQRESPLVHVQGNPAHSGIGALTEIPKHLSCGFLWSGRDNPNKIIPKKASTKTTPTKDTMTFFWAIFFFLRGLRDTKRSLFLGLNKTHRIPTKNNNQLRVPFFE